MKTFVKLLALLLASVLCTTGVSAGVIVTDSAGVTYESHKIDDRRLVRYSPDKPEKEFTISDTSVEPYSFEGAKNLEKITITDGVFYIGEYAFKDCTSLKEVVIDTTWGGVVIPENAFDGCTSLDPAVIEELCWENQFHDVFPQNWYFNAVKFVHKNGLMNGMSDDLFSPDTGMTRAMFVTVLGRLAGVTDVKEVVNKDGTPCIEWRLANGQWGGIAIAQTFTDVEEGQWYTDYVKWGAANGILQGYGNGTFGVDDKVTVEQAAVILYRYAALIETPLYDMEADYTDTDEISAWAMDAMRWVTATDIYDGYDGGQLRPKQNAARALVAEMLYNYVRETEKSDEIPEKRISEVEKPDWGLTLTASNVTSTGMTLTFTQSGGNVNGEYLNSGAYYFIETYKDGQWTEVEPKIRLNAWTEEGWPIPRNSKFVIEDSWEPLYGELPAGQYRMGKRVSDGLDYATFYAEFTICGNQLTSANLDGFAHEESNRCYVTYPGGKTVEIERGHIVLFVNGSVVEYEGIYLQDGVPVVPAKLVCEAIGTPYDAAAMTENMPADVLAEILGAEYRYQDASDRKEPYMYLGGKHVMIDRFDDTLEAKTEEEAAAHLKQVLTIAYETRFGEKFVPAEEAPSPYEEQTWHRYHIAEMDEDDIMFEVGRYYMIPYVWDFYVDKYTDDVYMMYNGIVNRITKYDPTSDGALTFAG